MEIFSTLKRKDFFELRGRKYSKANSFLAIGNLCVLCAPCGKKIPF
jgi:hypothetical protein